MQRFGVDDVAHQIGEYDAPRGRVFPRSAPQRDVLTLFSYPHSQKLKGGFVALRGGRWVEKFDVGHEVFSPARWQGLVSIMHPHTGPGDFRPAPEWSHARCRYFRNIQRMGQISTEVCTSPAAIRPNSPFYLHSQVRFAMT
jgi:hypothetical protein